MNFDLMYIFFLAVDIDMENENDPIFEVVSSGVGKLF